MIFTAFEIQEIYSTQITLKDIRGHKRISSSNFNSTARPAAQKLRSGWQVG